MIAKSLSPTSGTVISPACSARREMLSDYRPSRRQNRRSGPRTRDPANDAGVARTPDHTLLPPIRHTESYTGAYSCRHGSFTSLALAGKSAQVNIRSLASRAVWAPVGGDVNLKTILGWAAVAFIVWWVVEQPTDAAHL